MSNSTNSFTNPITATVKWFDSQKGYGFIAGPDGDVLVHYRALLQEGFKNLREGDKVQYHQHDTKTGLQVHLWDTGSRWPFLYTDGYVRQKRIYCGLKHEFIMLAALSTGCFSNESCMKYNC